MAIKVDKSALAVAVRKTAKLRVEDVGGFKERPAETVQSCLNRGYNTLGSDEGIEYILRHAVRYYLEALDSARFDLVAHLDRQRTFSRRTFGPGPRTRGVVDHIRKELAEIEADPADIMEWVDVVILAFDGAWRAGWEPEQIVAALAEKLARNDARTWSDWRTADPDKAIEHVRPAPPASAELIDGLDPAYGDGNV